MDYLRGDPVILEQFELVQLKDSVLELFHSQTRNSNVSLSFDIAENVPMVFIGDVGKLRQILFNIVGNALKFTDFGYVRVNVCSLPLESDEKAVLLFIVSDTGPGISDEQLNHIFEPFSQVEESYVRSHQGAGLGLSIVRRLVNLLGGSICVESELGHGSAFYISIPLINAHHEKQKEIQLTQKIVERQSSKLHILFAEDDSITRFVSEKLLEKSGYRVTLAVDGKDALEKLEAMDFDLILMDIQMPTMDGIEATQHIRFKDRFKNKRNIPIIAMTAYAMLNDRDKFLAAGMDDYISKPVDSKILVELIENVLARKRNIYKIS